MTERAARADLIIYSSTNFDIEISNPIDVGTTPLKAVTLTAIGKNGALPNTFDSDKSGLGGTGITTVDNTLQLVNALHQIWEGGLASTPTNTLLGFWGPIPQNLDTHFLVNNGDIFIPPGLDPAEDISPPSAEHTWGGYGTFLTGTFTDITAVNSSWPFAYLVVPNMTLVNLDFEIGADMFDSETVSGSIMIPEPNALILLGMGGMWLLVYAWRRRKW